MRRFAAALAGTVVALLVVEGGLRAGARWIFTDNLIRPDRELGWSLYASSGAWATDENPVWVTTNSAGYRDREHALQGPPGTVRIAVIGDSFIHSYFLELEETFGAALERGLARCPSAPRIEVLNFGVLNYNTTQELLTFRRDAARFSPDIVIAVPYVGNDVFDNHPEISTEPAPRYVIDDGHVVLDNAFRSQLPAPPAWPLRRRIFESVVAHSRVAQFLKESVSRLRGTDTAADDRAERSQNRWPIYQPPSTPLAEEAWSLTERVLMMFADEVRAHGAEFWLMPVFTPDQVYPDAQVRVTMQHRLQVEDLFYPTRRLETFAARAGLHVIHIAEPVAAYALEHHVHVMGGRTREVPPGTGHWNALGTTLSADIAARALCAQSAVLATR